MSAGIRQFEACLGADLIDRSGRRLALTEAGQSVLDRATSILRDAEDPSAMRGSRISRCPAACGSGSFLHRTVSVAARPAGPAQGASGAAPAPARGSHGVADGLLREGASMRR
ncbi:MAG: hypothetical protein HPM95_20795 [Alphaproteobacteria bacterium]|nr:hypothetical protein [Alphaproteobacteria bacterium]